VGKVHLAKISLLSERMPEKQKVAAAQSCKSFNPANHCSDKRATNNWKR